MRPGFRSPCNWVDRILCVSPFLSPKHILFSSCICCPILSQDRFSILSKILDLTDFYHFAPSFWRRWSRDLRICCHYKQFKISGWQQPAGSSMGNGLTVHSDNLIDEYIITPTSVPHIMKINGFVPQVSSEPHQQTCPTQKRRSCDGVPSKLDAFIKWSKDTASESTSWLYS